MKNQSENTNEVLKKVYLQQPGIDPVKKTDIVHTPETMQLFTTNASQFQPAFLEPAKVIISNMFSTVEKYTGLNTFAGVSRSLVFFSWKDYA